MAEHLLPMAVPLLRKTVRINLSQAKPLFGYQEEYDRFRERHAQNDVVHGDLHTYQGNAYLGVDAGSTTTKVALIGEDNSLLYSFYETNKGQPLECVKRALETLYQKKNPNLKICGSAVTGYGEEMVLALILALSKPLPISEQQHFSVQMWILSLTSAGKISSASRLKTEQLTALC